MNKDIFQKSIKYSFKDISLLEKALTHTSYCAENKGEELQSNQRLEFLGDAYFDAVISAQLYTLMEDSDEGKLSKTRALIVCEDSLAKVANSLEIGESLLMGKGEKNAGGRSKTSIQADALEAVIGAMFLDGGYAAVEEFVLREFESVINDAINGKIILDYKTSVQEVLQKKDKQVKIVYHLDKEEGPDHDKTFYVHLSCNGKILGRGMGKTKKKAEQNAAKAALEGGIV